VMLWELGVSTSEKRKDRCHQLQLRLFVMCVGDLFTVRFVLKGQSAGDTYIKITRYNDWVMSGLYINNIPFK
jgi:hypothetical protein